MFACVNVSIWVKWNSKIFNFCPQNEIFTMFFFVLLVSLYERCTLLCDGISTQEMDGIHSMKMDLISHVMRAHCIVNVDAVNAVAAFGVPTSINMHRPTWHSDKNIKITLCCAVLCLSINYSLEKFYYKFSLMLNWYNSRNVLYNRYVLVSLQRMLNETEKELLTATEKQTRNHPDS